VAESTMKLALPPAGSRIEELGDRLVVRFRPRRSWGELAFLTFWLVFWTFGGLAALAGLRHAGWGDGAFLLVWLCGWAFGEFAASATIAWQLFGHELLTVTAEHLEVREEIGRFARVKRHEVGLVHDVKAALVPTGEDEGPRADFCLKVAYDTKSIRVGEGMDEREAEYVASTVLSRLRPPARWGDEERVDPYGSPAAVTREASAVRGVDRCHDELGEALARFALAPSLRARLRLANALDQSSTGGA
jgi:hypothetical protein